MIQNWWHGRIIKRSTVRGHQWAQAFRQLPLLDGLSEPERDRLRELAILFLHFKSLEGTHGLTVSQHMSLIIALQACLPILKLGMQWYNGWVSVIVYPSEFVPDRTYVDEIGLAHQSDSVLSGESWGRGPVIISWEQSQHAGVVDGFNLIIHEFAHKLDLLNGVANGFPPLHRGMSPAKWSKVMAEAFADFQYKINSGIHPPIDGYAATSPAEFFAVFSEVFFERPDILQTFYPQVYDQFKQFYRQDPLARMPAG
jgi:hypothetical protein